MGLAGALGVAAAFGATGLSVTRRRIDWYEGLEKPPLTPPSSVFSPVWAFLYADQAIAAWLVWKDDISRAEFDVPAFASYSLQLALGVTWTLLFFGLRKPALALADICVLWLAIALTMREFARKHRVAAAMMLPYLGWATYAVVFTAYVWHRNR